MSTFCLVADVSCDLPNEILQHTNIKLLPTHVFVGDKSFVDTRDPVATNDFYEKYLSQPTAVEGRSEPMTAEEMMLAFNDQLAMHFDQALGVFVAASRSSIYNRAREALAYSRRQAGLMRAKVGNFKPLQADCLDSKALFAGYGAQLIELIDLMNRGGGIMEIIDRQRQIVPATYAYMAPGNVSYILKRAAMKGERSVSALAGFAAKTLSITPILSAHMGETAPVGRKLGKVAARAEILKMALASIEKKLLLSQHICLSYSGQLGDVTQMDDFKNLEATAKKRGIRVHLCRMSITGSVNVGPDALCMGMLAAKHEPQDLMK